MSDNFIGELKLVSFGFAPKGWATADGQTLAINQNQALFSLFGTMYGGNGTTNFQLPNLQGRVAASFGGGLTQGQGGGESTHTLISQEMPSHSHQVNAVNVAQTFADPTGRFFANQAPFYGTAGPIPILSADISNSGGSQPHENKQPFLVMNWIVALVGIFPSRN